MWGVHRSLVNFPLTYVPYGEGLERCDRLGRGGGGTCKRNPELIYQVVQIPDWRAVIEICLIMTLLTTQDPVFSCQDIIFEKKEIIFFHGVTGTTNSDKFRPVGNGRKRSDSSEVVGNGRKRSEISGRKMSERSEKVWNGRPRIPGGGLHMNWNQSLLK